MNSQEIIAIFDGQSLQLESPLNLEIGTRVKVTVETLSPLKEKQKTFLQTARSLNLEGDPDWSENIDQYLYGNLVAEND